jgi:transposase-like protein
VTAARTGGIEVFIPANNRIEADHGRLKARLQPMRGLKRFATNAVIALGRAFVQILRRGHHELAVDVTPAPARSSLHLARPDHLNLATA